MTSHWEPASGRGTIVSWIVNRHAFSPAFASPYVVVSVRLDEQDDVVMPSGWGGLGDGSDLAVGMPVSVTFVDLDADEADEADAGGGPATLLSWNAVDKEAS
jgi:hypothetical protein